MFVTKHKTKRQTMSNFVCRCYVLIICAIKLPIGATRMTRVQHNQCPSSSTKTSNQSDDGCVFHLSTKKVWQRRNSYVALQTHELRRLRRGIAKLSVLGFFMMMMIFSVFKILCLEREAGFNEELPLPFKGKDFNTENVCFENSAPEGQDGVYSC